MKPVTLRKKLQSLIQSSHGTSFRWIFLALSMAGTAFAIVSLSIVYFSMRESVTNNIQDSRIMTTTQIMNTFEREIQTIEKSFNAYSSTGDFYEVVEEPFGVSDFRKYRELSSLLNYFSTYSMEGTTYSIASVKHPWIFSEGSLKQQTSEEQDHFLSTYLTDRTDSLFWVREGKYLRSVSLLPFFSSDKVAVGFADIPIRSIDRLLDAPNATTPFFIVNRLNEALYSHVPENMDTTLSREAIEDIRLAAEQNKSAILDDFTGNSSGNSLIYAQSDYNNWLYVTYLDHTEIRDALFIPKIGLITLGVVVSMLSVAIAYFVAGRVTRPIENLISSLAAMPDSESAAKNDWEYISQRIDSIVTEKQTLQHLYQREEPELKKQFMLNLYRGRLLPMELEQKLVQFRYPVRKDGLYTTMLIQMDEYGSRETINKDIFLVGINQMVRDLIPSEQRFTPIVLNDAIQVTLLSLPNDSLEAKKHAQAYAQTVIDALDSFMNVSVSVGFSPFYEELLQTKEQVDLGRSTLSYHRILGKQAIIFYEDVEQSNYPSEISEYPHKLESQLFEAIRLGERELVSELAPRLLDSILLSSTLSINVQVALLRLALNLVQLAQTVNATSLSQERGNQLYEQILQTQDFTHLSYVFQEQIIYPLAAEMSEKNAQQFHRLSEQMIRMIEANYSEDLTLDTIGLELHYNPNYLSNIFKKETGVTFSDYLSSFRFDIAKEWLRTTDITIKEISERLQYRNPQNFIRSFKKKEGMTPGEYRKLYSPS